MVKATEQHVSQIEEKLKKLRKHVEALGNPAEHEELLRIIHRPGWTTQAESTFVNGILDAMQKHAEMLTHLHQVLMDGSRAVGSK